MSKIKISGNGAISAVNLQIGDKNRNKVVLTKEPLGQHEKELLKLFDTHCPTETEKQALIEDLKKLESNAPTAKESANRIYNFLLSVGSGLVSNELFSAIGKLLHSH